MALECVVRDWILGFGRKGWKAMTYPQNWSGKTIISTVGADMGSNCQIHLELGFTNLG